jgi:Papain-like cysteine protease AvrRpt2
MLSAVITALLFVVMLLIVASFVNGAVRERQRHLQSQLVQKQCSSQFKAPTQFKAPDQQVTAVLQFQDGSVVGLEKSHSPFYFALPTSWYRRRRTVVSFGLLLMVVITLFAQSGLADGALQGLKQRIALLDFTQHTSAFDLSTSTLPLDGSASSRIVRIDSAIRGQYYTDYQWQVWSYSSCSGISMEEVMDAYGRHLIAADVLQVESNLGVWDTYNGLTGGEPGIAKVASYFGFKAVPNPPRTIQDLVAVSNKGFPVIVGVPGHILVVRGGDSNNVYLVDSAPADRTIMSRAEFAGWWDNFSVELLPN